MFYSPGAGGNPFSTAPRDTSYLVNVRVDSSRSQCCGDTYNYAAINGQNRPILFMDSVTDHKAFDGAVVLSARGSRLSRSTIDTTGMPTSSYSAVVLGDSTLLEQTLVRRSGNVGVYA